MDRAQEKTKESFSYQWSNLNDSPYQSDNPEFLAKSKEKLLQDTGMKAAWFKGKRILDAGCGGGRWTYALLQLGAKVTAIDYADGAVERTRKVCKRFGKRLVVRRADILSPDLLKGSDFDMVFSWGVLHHTGNTRKAFGNIARLVKPGGYLFVYLYGPNKKVLLWKAELQRKILALLPLSWKVKVIALFKPKELVHEYFDAYSPAINDHLSEGMVAGLFKENGFSHRRTNAGIDIMMVGKRIPR
jgi:2-polyprenyl-3-methyl-5-hydroxy-6-metoxy-1,4-benzoquinol methylase